VDTAARSSCAICSLKNKNTQKTEKAPFSHSRL